MVNGQMTPASTAGDIDAFLVVVVVNVGSAKHFKASLKSNLRLISIVVYYTNYN